MFLFCVEIEFNKRYIFFSCTFVLTTREMHSIVDNFKFQQRDRPT